LNLYDSLALYDDCPDLIIRLNARSARMGLGQKMSKLMRESCWNVGKPEGPNWSVRFISKGGPTSTAEGPCLPD